MELFKQLKPNTLLLTPNRRLSAALAKKYQQFKLHEKEICWPTFNVMPFTSWLQFLWNDYCAQRIESTAYLLKTNQEQILWEEILTQSPESSYLLQLSATAELAKSAWGTLKQWQVDLNHPGLKATEDSLAFLRWATLFEKRCAQHNWLDTNSLPNEIIAKIKCGDIIPPPQIILLGFTEISPQYQSLLATCEQVGSKIIYHESTAQNNKIQCISLADEETEIRTLARWAKKLFAANANKKIGCVIPNLESIRDSVMSIFSDVFNTTLPFNISAGKSLASYPIIHTALQLLNLTHNDIPIETISGLLRSPFIGEAEHELSMRAQFDSLLRRTNKLTISLDKIIEITSCPALKKRLQNYVNFPSASLPISEWVNIFMERLATLGWPGERSLNSHEYQVVQAWLNVLEEYKTIEAVLPAQHAKKAVHYLQQLTAKTIFQPQSPEAPVQILGMLEAAEIPFDHLWVMGLDDTTWPPSPKPNPLIPLRLQATLHMPHATAERELTYCQRLTHQLAQSAEHVIFSHALQNNESKLRPSPLLNNIDSIILDQIQLENFISPTQFIYNHRKLELIHDESAPPIMQNQSIRGGVNIFKQQAACPFKAFVELRLHARKLETPTPGLRAQDRGTIVHKALEFIWQELKNSENLVNLSTTELQKLISDSAIKAIQKITGDKIKNSRYLTLELQRMQKIMLDWLQLEKSRPDFKVISQEQEKAVTIGNIPITLRVDRIDELANGNKLIIDYKTGKNYHPKDWFGERPDEPQLPLYCIADLKNTTGIAFAQIHPNKMELKGISKNNLDIKSIKSFSEWDQQTHTWQATLEKIGQDFHQGKANVDPKDPNQTCRYCHLHSLCRINEEHGETP